MTKYCHTRSITGLLLLAAMLLPQWVAAEPYLAVREGLKCSACHSNPAGGGKRNQFGRIYGQTALPKRPSTAFSDQRPNEFFDVGGNFRFNASSFVSSGDTENTLSFEVERANVYLESVLIADKLSFYIDQQFSPASENREAWALYSLGDKVAPDSHTYIKAGKIFLPFGMRIQDDSALVRSTSGINFLTPDNGVELGIERNQWSTQVALSNGTAGASENNVGKQLSARTVYVESDWRIGASVGFNDGIGDTDRTLFSVFSGIRGFGSEFLLELDLINDSTAGDDRSQLASLLEFNREVAKGHNLKLSAEYHDPDLDIDEDHRSRLSVVWEATPVPLLQLRFGARLAEGIPQNVVQNTDLYFVQLHAWY